MKWCKTLQRTLWLHSFYSSWLFHPQLSCLRERTHLLTMLTCSLHPYTERYFHRSQTEVEEERIPTSSQYFHQLKYFTGQLWDFTRLCTKLPKASSKLKQFNFQRLHPEEKHNLICIELIYFLKLTLLKEAFLQGFSDKGHQPLYKYKLSNLKACLSAQGNTTTTQ